MLDLEREERYWKERVRTKVGRVFMRAREMEKSVIVVIGIAIGPGGEFIPVKRARLKGN